MKIMYDLIFYFLKWMSLGVIFSFLSHFTYRYKDLMLFMNLLSIFIFLKFQKHFFMSLLILEMIMLFSICMMLGAWSEGNFNSMVYFAFLTVSVCEAVFGVSILIKYSRFWGNELMKI